MRPELPYLAAGAISIIGGSVRDKKLPDNAIVASIGTVLLVIAASTTTGTKLAPLVHAIGLLYAMAVVMALIANRKKIHG